MGTKLEELLKRHPRAVQAIEEWCGVSKLVLRHDAGRLIREYAYKHNIEKDQCELIALSDLLAAIESHLAATEPLSDEEIEGMKWDRSGAIVGSPGLAMFSAFNAENAANACASHNANIDRLHAEIGRLRKGGA